MRRLVHAGIVTAMALGGSASAASNVRVPGGVILFRADRTGQTMVYTARADGSALREVARASSAQASPDGSGIAWIRYEAGTGQTLHVRRAGRSLRLPLAGYAELVRAPDSRRLAVSLYANGIFSIAVLDTRRAVWIDRIAEADEPSWAPNGSGFLYRGPSNELRFHSASGDRLVATGVHPRWSADGRWIAYARNKSLLVKNLATGEEREVTTPDPADFVWAPKGHRLAYTFWSQLASLNSGAVGTYVFELDTRTTSRVSKRGPAALAWSPDGRALALGDALYDEHAGVWVVAADGRWERRATKTTVYGYNSSLIQWLPRVAAFGDRVPWSLPREATQVGNVLRTEQQVKALYAGGATAAIVNAGSHCVVAWRPRTRELVRFNPSHCSWEVTSVAVGGDAIGWTGRTHAGRSHFNGELATLRVPAPRRFARVCVADDSYCDEHPLGDVQTDGTLWAFDVRCTSPACASDAQGELWRLDGTTPTKIATTPAPLRVLAIDAGRIVVATGDGLAIFDRNGTELRDAHIDGLADAALAGSDLVALTRDALLHFDARSLALRRTFAIDNAAGLAGVAGGVAAWWRDDRVHVLRLGDGSATAVRVPASLVGARLMSAGLFIAWNANDAAGAGRVSFTPLKTLGRAFAEVRAAASADPAVSSAQELRTCVERWNQNTMLSWGSMSVRIAIRQLDTRERARVSFGDDAQRRCTLSLAGRPGDNSWICRIGDSGGYACPLVTSDGMPTLRNANGRTDRRGLLKLDAPPGQTHPTPPLPWQRRYPHVDGFILPWTPAGNLRAGLRFSATEHGTCGSFVETRVPRSAVRCVDSSTYAWTEPCFPERRNFRAGDLAACTAPGRTSFVRWRITARL